MFEYENETYTLEDLQVGAKEQGLDFDTYLEGMKNLGMVEKQAETPTAESSLVYTIQEETGEWAKSMDAGETYELVDEADVPDAYKQMHKEELEKRKTKKLQDARVEESSREILKDVYSNISNVPKWAIPYVANLAGGTARILSGIFKTGEAGYETYIEGLTAEEQREEGVNPVSRFLDEFYDESNTFDTKYYDDEGNPMQVDQLLSEGKYKEAAIMASEQAAESAPSMVASVYAPGAGGALLGVSTTGNTFKDDLENRPEEVLNDVVKNALWAGGSEWLTEWAGGMFFRGVTSLGKTGATQDVVKDFTRNYTLRFLGRTIGSSATEGMTEGLNARLQDLGEERVYGDEKTTKELWSNVVNSVVPALLLGGTGGSLASISKPDKQSVYKYVAPQKWKKEQLDIGKQIYETSLDLEQADASTRPVFEEKIKKLKQKRDQREKALFETFNNMTDGELNTYAKNIDAANKNLNIIDNDKYSEAAQKEAELKNIDLIQENLNLLGRDYDATDITVEKTIGEALKASEVIQERLNKIKGINREDLDIKILKTEEEIKKAVDEAGEGIKESDGAFIAKGKDGKATIYINQNVAAEAGATNVLGHELLHYMISRKFKTDNKSMKPLVDELKTYLQENHGGVFERVQQRIDKHYTNKDGTIKDGALEEYLNVFSDLMSKQKLDIKEVESKGLRGGIKDLMAGFGFGKVELNTAQDVVSFLSTYNKNINRKGLLGKLMGTKILDVGLVSEKLTEGETKNIKKKSITAEEKAEIEDEVKALGETYEVEGGNEMWNDIGADEAINEIKEKGYLDNLIAAKYKADIVPKNFVNDVMTELTKHIKSYKPETQLQYDADERTGLFGWINPQIRNKANKVYNEIYKKKEDAPGTAKDVDAKTAEGAPITQIVSKELTPEEAMIAKEEAKKKVKTKEQKIAALDKKLGLTDKDIDKFITTLEKAFGTKLPSVTSKEYRLALEKIITTDLKNTLQGIFGKGVDYDIFVEQDIPLLLGDIRVEALIQMEREVGGKRFPDGRKIFANKRRITKVKEVRELQAKGLIAKDVKPESGPNLLTRLPRPNKKEINAWFRGINMKEVLGYELSKSAFGTRKDRLAENLAIEVGFNKAIQVVQDPKVLAKRLAVEELQGRERIENYVAEVGRTIDRDPTIKQSKSVEFVKKELGLSNADIDKILKENDINQLEAKHPRLHDALWRDMEEKYGPQEFVNKRFLKQIQEASPELAKLVKDKVHITRYKVGVDQDGKSIYEFDVKVLKEHFNNYSLGLLDFIPSFMGKRENNVIGNLKFLTNAILKASSSRGLGGETLQIRQKRAEKFKDKYTNDMGKNMTPRAKKLWGEFGKVMDKLQLAESTFDMPETLLRELRRIQRSKKTAKQKIKEAQKLFEPGALDAAQKLFTAYNASIEDWVNHQVDNNKMTREEAAAYILRDKQKNTNFTKGERALAAFTSVYLEDGVQKLEKKDSKGEHVTDSATVSALTVLSIYNNTLVQDAPSILNGFEQSYVPKKFADEMDKLGGANSPLKNFRFILNPQIGKKVYDLVTGKTMYEIGLEQYKLDQIKTLGEAYLKHNNNKPLNDAIKFSKSANNEAKGITVLDFDDTLATTKSLVRYTTPDGKKGTLNAEEYASQYQDLLEQGYVFDFTEFNKVVKAKLAPLFQKALKLQKKFGPENMFILTARPMEAQKPIFDFLKANGLNIPIKNITGLGNSTSEAKALWIADKVGEGYNDFYFADDALQNVQAVDNVLEQFDVKRKVQQAKVKFSKSMNKDFNDILENVTGIESKKRFSAIKARKRGESKGKFRFFIPPSHEDFVGLLYNFMGKGKEGNAHRDFFEKALIKPLNRAYRELNTAKQAIANDYKSLNKQFPDIKKKLTKKTPDGDFTYQDAIRVYLWNKHGHKVPGLSETDQQGLVDLVIGDTELQTYAETLNIISKQDSYIAPIESWEGGDIRTDLDDATGRIGREQFFVEFFENTDIIFSQENLNKIEAAYGADVVSAIKDILYRTKTGKNRPSGQNKLVNKFITYLNGSVASTMFFNIRSAVLQQMSMVNFINYSDNNVLAAAKAFANQKQYWTDWAYLFNSDFMKQRRAGIKTDVNGAELAASVKNATNPAQAAIKKLLQLGFLPTQIGDNMAIATGGATYYRNRINTYLKQGLSQKEAEAKAFIDFQVLAEATQQSARPDMLSQQQASPLGKFILAFQNITSQMNRLGKKSFSDLYNRRISPEYKNAKNPQLQSDMSNISRIGYYFAIQNLIFYSLQSALFMAMFDSDEDDERFLKKKERMINGSIDSVLRGSGVMGGVIATLKNMAIKWHEQRNKGYNADESAVLMEMLNVSPPLGIKARKMVNAEKTLNYNKKIIDEMETFDIDNPQWSAVTNYVEATTNVPLNRLYNKTQNVRQSLDNQHSALERALMFSGWSQWNLGIENQKIEDIKEKVKKKKQGFGNTTFEKKTFKRKEFSR